MSSAVICNIRGQRQSIGFVLSGFQCNMEKNLRSHEYTVVCSSVVMRWVAFTGSLYFTLQSLVSPLAAILCPFLVFVSIFLFGDASSLHKILYLCSYSVCHLGNFTSLNLTYLCLLLTCLFSVSFFHLHFITQGKD